MERSTFNPAWQTKKKEREQQIQQNPRTISSFTFFQHRKRMSEWVSEWVNEWMMGFSNPKWKNGACMQKLLGKQEGRKGVSWGNDGVRGRRVVHVDVVGTGSANIHTPPLLWSVKLIAGWIFSTPWRPGMPIQCAGGRDPAGINSGAKLKERKRCSRRTMKYPASLSAKSCPRQTRGPP